MREIGIVKQVQVQRGSLKVGEKPNQRYDPAALLVVDSLEVSGEGVVGLLMDGGRLIDVHHAAHPNSKNQTRNGISVGFTGHYAAMRQRFGAHMADGIAGENILIESAHPWRLAELGTRLVFESAAGQVHLDEVLVALPCTPFSQFALQAPASGDPLKAALQFLNEGTRGFYATAPQPGVIQSGDRVLIVG